MKVKSLPIGIILVVLLVLSSAGLSAAHLVRAAQAPVPQGKGTPQSPVGSAFTYQGELMKDGSPINATCAMTFTLYDDAAAGNPVGSPINADVAVAGGHFTAALDFGGEIFTGDARWLEVAVLCPGDANSSTLNPRQALTAAPYALSLQPGALISGTALAAPLGPGAVLTVRNSATTTAANGVYGRTDSTDGAGVRGYAAADSGENYGVYGRSNSPSGHGVYGYANAASGSAYGVYGESESTSGRGVSGYVLATAGTNFGVFGRSDSTSGRGVGGLAFATSGESYGLHGVSHSTEGRGVGGFATATTGYAAGVYGASSSPYGYGVYGTSTASAGTGVYGRSVDGTAIQGSTDGGIGVYAYADFVNGVALRAEGQQGGNLIEAWHGPLFIDRKFYVADNGNVYADGAYLSGAAEYANLLPDTAGLEAGDVLAIGPGGTLARCTVAYQPTVVGVYVPQDGLNEETMDNFSLAVVGVVRVKVSAENGPIVPGDLLVASATAGHAMRAGADPALGTVIGKALEPLDKDTGTLLMLVMLR